MYDLNPKPGPTQRYRLEKFKNQPSINEVLANPELLCKNSWCWSFYDWFCPDRSLERRAKALLPKVKFLVDIGLVNGDENYVWFKNNCPMCGTLYDDIRISSLVSGDEEGWSKYLGGLAPRSGHYTAKFKCTIWTLYNNGDGSVMQDATSWSELKRELKRKEKSHIYRVLKEGFSA